MSKNSPVKFYQYNKERLKKKKKKKLVKDIKEDKTF